VFRFLVAVIGVTMLVAALIERSPLRREAVATRDAAVIAQTAGVPVLRVNLTMFALGSAMGGLSGALIGHWGGIVAADSFGIPLGIGLFLMVILGGSGSPWGALVGAAFYVWVPELLASFTSWKQVIYGSLLLVTIIALPEGIIGLLRRAAALVDRRRPPGGSAGGVGAGGAIGSDDITQQPLGPGSGSV
jgi:branched-chain amino acid transport system permease protein